MIRLNLGCGGPGLRSWHPLPEPWINRDPDLDGWRFEHGLGEYADGSVEAVSISHALMYLRDSLWPAFFADVARVLCVGGVIRITEDNTEDSRSKTYPNGWQGSAKRVTLTYPAMVKRHMREAGLIAEDCDAAHTNFRDPAIMQDQHGGAPHCFFVEAIKMAKSATVGDVAPEVSDRVRVFRDSNSVLFAPHSDDETLFAAFTILKYRPRIVTVFGSSGDYGDTLTRHAETLDAMSILGGADCRQWNGGDTESVAAQMLAYDTEVGPSLVFAPAEKTSHPDHVTVAIAAREVFGDRLRCYHTYDANGKVREGREVPFEPVWVQAKLRALARYETQIRHPRACQFFTWGLDEWLDE